MKLPNGEKIEGRWTNNLLNGKAIFTEMNGDRYEEVYKDEIPEGPRKALKRKGTAAHLSNNLCCFLLLCSIYC